MSGEKIPRPDQNLALTPDQVASIFRDGTQGLSGRGETPVQRALRLSVSPGETPEPAVGSMGVSPSPSAQAGMPIRQHVVLSKHAAKDLQPPQPAEASKSGAGITSLNAEQLEAGATVQSWLLYRSEVSRNEIRQLPRKVRSKARRVLEEHEILIVQDDKKSPTTSPIEQSAARVSTDVPKDKFLPETSQRDRRSIGKSVLSWIVLGRGLTLRKVGAGAAACAVIGAGVGVVSYYGDANGYNTTKEACASNSLLCEAAKGITEGGTAAIDGVLDTVKNLLPGGRVK